MDSVSERALQRLTANLEDLVTIYRQLLECVRKERELLVGADLVALELNNQEKDSLIMKARLADALRQKLASECASHAGADAQNPRLLEIAQKRGGPHGDRLRQLHATLETLVKRLVELNRENEAYATTALKNLNGALTEIKETLSGKKTYERRGQYKLGPETTGNFVRKEA